MPKLTDFRLARCSAWLWPTIVSAAHASNSRAGHNADVLWSLDDLSPPRTSPAVGPQRRGSKTGEGIKPTDPAMLNRQSTTWVPDQKRAPPSRSEGRRRGSKTSQAVTINRS